MLITSVLTPFANMSDNLFATLGELLPLGIGIILWLLFAPKIKKFFTQLADEDKMKQDNLRRYKKNGYSRSMKKYNGSYRRY